MNGSAQEKQEIVRNDEHLNFNTPDDKEVPTF